MIDVWIAELPLRVPPCLDADERARRDRFSSALHRADFEQAHAFKRCVLSHYHRDQGPAAWRFRCNAFGKPSPDPPLALGFSLSHAARHVAMAVTEADVGVDVEPIREMPTAGGIAARVFHPVERGWLAEQADAAEAFFRLWTLKEALLKAIGTGFSRPAQTVCWRILGTGLARARVDGRDWIAASHRLGETMLAVAVPARCDLGAARLLRLAAMHPATGTLRAHAQPLMPPPRRPSLADGG